MTLRYDVNISILLTELPLLQRPQAARDAGQNKLDEMGINKGSIGGAVKDLAGSAADAAKRSASKATA